MFHATEFCFLTIYLHWPALRCISQWRFSLFQENCSFYFVISGIPSLFTSPTIKQKWKRQCKAEIFLQNTQKSEHELNTYKGRFSQLFGGFYATPSLLGSVVWLLDRYYFPKLNRLLSTLFRPYYYLDI